MKRTALLIMAALALAFPPSAPADTSELIPTFYGTCHSLSALAAKGLVGDAVVQGKSAFKPDPAASMDVTALKRGERGVPKLEEQELTATRAGFPEDGSAACTADERELAAKAALSINRFTFDLYKAASEKRGGNIFLSPYSVSTALAMTYAGARGVTAEEMASALHFTPDVHKGMGALISSVNAVPEETALIRSANALWPASGEKILPEFYQLVRLSYRAGLRRLDYADDPEAARSAINKWVEDRTNEKITDIIPGGALTRETKIVLTNAVYFKAGWQEAFEEADTARGSFWISAEEPAAVPMMHRETKSLAYAKLDGAEMIDMPYKEGRFSMLVLLPCKNASINELEARLSVENIAKWLAAMEPSRAEIFMPKFRQEDGYELSLTLSRLGMPSAFKPGAADFSGISGERNFCISGVLHKPFIEVADEGTEAAASTAVVMMRTSLSPPQEKIIFRADRPFVYMIRDNESGAILFIGRYAKP